MSEKCKDVRFLMPIDVQVPDGWVCMLRDGKTFVFERVSGAEQTEVARLQKIIKDAAAVMLRWNPKPGPYSPEFAALILESER